MSASCEASLGTRYEIAGNTETDPYVQTVEIFPSPF